MGLSTYHKMTHLHGQLNWVTKSESPLKRDCYSPPCKLSVVTPHTHTQTHMTVNHPSLVPTTIWRMLRVLLGVFCLKRQVLQVIMSPTL